MFDIEQLDTREEYTIRTGGKELKIQDERKKKVGSFMNNEIFLFMGKDRNPDENPHPFPDFRKLPYNLLD